MNFTSFLQDKRLTVLLSGEIDHHTARGIMGAITSKIDVYLPRRCVLDLGAVTFMDSSGIAIVIHSLRSMRELGGELALINVPPQPLKVLQAAGIQRLVPVDRERSPA